MMPPDKGRLDADSAQARTIALPALQKKELIDSKLNILNLLRNHKSGGKPEVFKPIGDRIVVPVKLCLSAKKSLTTNNASYEKKVNSTFTMAVPANKVSPKLTLFNPTIVRKSAIAPKHSDPTSNQKPKALAVTVKLPPTAQQKDAVEYGDLNKFMSTVSRNMGLPGQGDLDVNGKTVPDGKTSPPALDRKPCVAEDDELTSLSWLSSDNKELYNVIKKLNPDDPGIGLSGDEMDSEETSDSRSIFTASSKVDKQSCYRGLPQSSAEFNPLGKPPYSFSCLIFMAIEDSSRKMLPVKEIYSWVCKHFPYFRSAPQGWKNSIRHNLSLNRCFKKAECMEAIKDTVKGSLWCIDPAYRPNLVQALKRSPSYPYLHPSGLGQPLTLCNLGNLLHGVHSGSVPSWSPCYPPTSGLWADPDMASAALNLIGLRGSESSPKSTNPVMNTLNELQQEIFREYPQGIVTRNRTESIESVGTEQLVISDASEDHNYISSKSNKDKAVQERCISPDSEKSAPDAAYEFETGWASSEDDEDDRVIEEIMADQSDQEEMEDRELFDSGFGSMRGRKENVCKRRRSRSKSSTKSKRQKLDHVGKKPLASGRRKKAERKIAKASKLRVRVPKPTKRSAPPKSKKKVEPKRERKLSDVDSGKDSPKVTRTRRRRITPSPKAERKTAPISPPSKPQRSTASSPSSTRYNTRSTGSKVDKRKDRDSKKLLPTRCSARRRKRLMSNTKDEEEEIKLAAGSLLRLAGLLNSPVPSSRAGSS